MTKPLTDEDLAAISDGLDLLADRPPGDWNLHRPDEARAAVEWIRAGGLDALREEVEGLRVSKGISDDDREGLEQRLRRDLSSGFTPPTKTWSESPWTRGR
jgi:hypothetical protein